MNNWPHPSMRGEFAYRLYEQMMENKNIWLVVLDLGYHVFDKHRLDFPNRVINVGASEQAGLDLACGLSLGGKIPFVYSITPFLIYRGFETIRTYINHEQLNVKLIGSGRDHDYAHDGISHFAHDVEPILTNLSDILQFYPTDKDQIDITIQTMIETDKPCFLSLTR